MKKLLAVSCVFLGLSTVAVQVQSSAATEKRDNIRKLIVLTGGARIVDQMFDAMAANFKDPKQQQAFADFRREFDVTQVYEIVIPAYDKFLSDDDVKEILRFYESPAGRKLLDSQPKIMAEVMPAILEWSQEIAKRAMQRVNQQERK